MALLFRPLPPTAPPTPPSVVLLFSDPVSGGAAEPLREGLKASFKRPTGEGLRRCEDEVGARRVSDFFEVAVSPSDCRLGELGNGGAAEATVSAFIRGEEMVRYPACD